MKIPSMENDNSYSPEGSIDSDDKPESAPDFSEYMWMENEEEFDKEVMKQLEEEASNTTEEVPEKEENPCPEPDFSEFMWMENEEEFDKEVMKQFEQDALMEQCIEAMLQDELKKKTPHAANNFVKDFEKLGIQEKADLAKKSTLNPDAAEFVPRFSIGENSQAANDKRSSSDAASGGKALLNNR